MTEREFQKELINYHDTGNMSVKLAVELLNGANLECLYDDETYYARDMAIPFKTGKLIYRSFYRLSPTLLLCIQEQHLECAPSPSLGLKSLAPCEPR
jgi:hypothetical protein